MNKVSIKDIAKKAGVANSTVTSALDPTSKKVSQKKRLEILQIVDEMGYIPNKSAQMLSSSKGRIIGLIMVTDSDEGFTRSIIKQKWIYFLNMLCSDKEIELITFIIKSENTDITQKVRNIIYKHNLTHLIIDGLSDEEEVINSLAKFPLQKIFIETPIVLSENSSFITTDNFKAQRDLIRQVIKENKISNVLFIPGPEGSAVARDRRSGFKEAMRGSDVNIAELIGSYDFKEVLPQLEKLDMTEYDFIVAPSDLIVQNIIKYLKSIKITPPLMSGFDGDHTLAFSNVTLYTVVQKVDTMAEYIIDSFEKDTFENKIVGYDIIRVEKEDYL